jgi:hypothetical protein
MLIITNKPLMLIAIILNIIILIVTYNPFMLSVIKLIVIMQSVIILSVTASKKILKFFTDEMKILSLNFVLRTRHETL